MSVNPQINVVGMSLLPLEKITASNLQRDLFSIWRRHNGQINDDLISYERHLVILGHPTSSIQTPRIFLMGQSSLARRMLGVAWDKREKELETPLQEQVKRALAAGYMLAHKSNEPVFEYVELVNTQFDCGDATVRYERLILPFHNADGLRFMFTFCHPLAILHLDVQSDPKHQSGWKEASNYQLAPD